jgi:hypothetical protein
VPNPISPLVGSPADELERGLSYFLQGVLLGVFRFDTTVPEVSSGHD